MSKHHAFKVKTRFQLDPNMHVFVFFKFIQLVWKVLHKLKGCRNFPSPRGACWLQIIPSLSKLELGGFSTAVVAHSLEVSMLFFYGQSVFFSQSVISGVGRGASSRPHHWHSCPCSTHNTEPLVAWQSTHISTTFISHSAPYFCLVSPLAPN